MKNWQIMGVLTVLIIGTVLMCGCTNTGSTSTAPVAVSSPTPTPTPTLVPLTITRAQYPLRIGDIVSHDSDPKYTSTIDSSVVFDSGTVIYDVDSVNKKYTTNYVSRSPGETQWKRQYPDLKIESIEFGNGYYLYLIDHVDISQIETKYPSKEAFDAWISNVKSRIKSTSSQSMFQFSGSGDDTREFFVTGSGGFLITGSYSGKNNFIVKILNNNGEWEDLVFNKIGSYYGTRIVNLPPGKHYLEVQSSGSWTIDMSPT